MGATMRHTDAGLAIPDFPLAFGHLIPPHWDAKIAIHFAHRVGALIVSVMALATDRSRLLSPPPAQRRSFGASALLLALITRADHAGRADRAVAEAADHQLASRRHRRVRCWRRRWC